MDRNSTPAATTSPSRGFVALMAAMTALGPMSIDMYLPSMRNIAADLHVDISQVQPTVAIFFIGLAAGQLFYGPLSDRLGRRGPILFGTGVFLIGSVVSMLAGHLGVMLAGRLAQALGACACMVVSRAVIRDRFELRDSARFFSLLALIGGIAPILAPLVGAGLLVLFGWRGIFGVLGAFGALLLVWVWQSLPESRSARTAELARNEHPLRSYHTLLTNKRLLGFLGAGALNGAAMFTYIAASPTVLIDVYHLTPTQFSLLFGLNSIGLVAASQLNRVFLHRYTVETVLRGATISCAAVVVLLPLAAFTGMGGLAGICVPLFLAVSTTSLIQANALAGALAVDPMRAGAAAALYGSGSFATGSLFAWLSGMAYDHSARPMAITIAAAFVGSALLLRFALHRGAEAAAAPAAAGTTPPR